MAPKLEHLLDSSCYSATYPPTSELDTIPHFPNDTMPLEQHSSPFPDFPPYFPGSQQTLLLNASGSGSGSIQPDTTSPLPSGSDYILNPPFPPYYPPALTNNLGIVSQTPDNFNHSEEMRFPDHFPPQTKNSLFSTPIKQRIGTASPPHEQSKITVDKLAKLLQKELETNRKCNPAFIPLIFPDRFLPIPVDAELFKVLLGAKIWDSFNRKLILRPSSYSEDHIALWLNSLAEKMGECFPGHEVKRSWYAGNKAIAPKGSAIIRKPDIILLNTADATRIISSQNTSYEEKTQWAMIMAFGETTSEKKPPQRMLDTVDGKSYVMFTSQHDRRFVPALCFDGTDHWSFTITDRQGQLTSGSLSFSKREDVTLFLRVIIALMFGQDMHLGLDPNMLRDVNHHVSKIFVDGTLYSVRRNIYSLQSLLGRGTKVWIVTKDHTPYILKDAWIQASRVENENNHLKKIQGIPVLKGKVPTLVAGEDVLIDDMQDSTLWYRMGLGRDDEHRVHRRVLTSNIGNSITTFTSKAEFIRAMIDVVKSTSRNNAIYY
jgi:hypothetical protein